jgi:monovalent cation:H+ antiporter-2, CPA2 family
MHSVNFLQDLAVVMLVAGLVTIIFHRFKQPVVLGNIIAGVIIGPHTPPYALIHDEATINTLSELVIATFRKLQALGLLVAETRVTPAAAGERTTAIRAVVAQIVPIAGTVALGVFILVLSSSLLPSLNVLILLVLIVGCMTWLLWRSFIRIYSKAQVALQETFGQPPPPRPHSAPAALQSMLREADLETVTIAKDSPAAGKLIRELELRTRTGASIVGIGRSGTNIINPSADEELQFGDQVLLVGNRAELDAARRCL